MTHEVNKVDFILMLIKANSETHKGIRDNEKQREAYTAMHGCSDVEYLKFLDRLNARDNKVKNLRQKLIDNPKKYVDEYNRLIDKNYTFSAIELKNNPLSTIPTFSIYGFRLGQHKLFLKG